MRASAWYVVQAKRHQEERVRAHLAGKALPVFLPLLEVVHRYRARRVRRLEPLFPGYLFVRLDGEAAGWQAVRWSPGVHRILTVADEPVAVPDGIIEAIQARIGTLGFVRPGITYRPGSRVRILRGPLAGLDAVFARPMSRTGRVRVLVQLLGGRRRVELDELDLEPV
jgi:transcriptional antiterminator RfaH